jgi:preprotein translocase subunit SecA
VNISMSRADLPMPGLLWGHYPERRPAPRQFADLCTTWLRDGVDRLADACGALSPQRDARWLARVRAAQSALARQGDTAAMNGVRAALLREGLSERALVQALAWVSNLAHARLGVQPFDTQLVAARAVLTNQLAEMATGEGKTLAVALAAAVAALAGMPVHVITANDYLVARDARGLRPLCAALGLTVGAVVQADAPAKRSRAYACNITYVTAKELVFDYLRDGLTGTPSAQLPGQAPGAALLRGLCMAIVDEADAILIDEARVPLILSQRAAAAVAAATTTSIQAQHRQQVQHLQHAHHALRFAKTLHEGADFLLDAETLTARLTDAGRTRLDRAAVSLAEACASPAWRNGLHREHTITTALAALHLYEAERHYLVRDGRAQIVDETTGRIADGRVWSNGLQQFIEAKEGLTPTPAMQTLAQITYQRFFPRYLRLGGLSGTLREARSELLGTYGVSLRRVPLRRPCRRSVGRSRLFADHTTLWEAVVQRVAVLHGQGRPVLLAVDSVAEAQALAAQLTVHDLPHAVLHARNDHQEAAIVAQAGRAGAITVTTNLAGRGTDIELGAGVQARGGLHVISCQLNSARRIDRQLAGRAARQGDAGSVETWLSLDTTLLVRSLPAPLRAALRRWATALPSVAVRALLRLPQWAEEQRQRGQRQRLIEHDERAERQLGFAGTAE